MPDIESVTVSFAANELCRYLEAICGGKFEVRPIGNAIQLPENCIISLHLAHTQRSFDEAVRSKDAYSVVVNGKGIKLSSLSERSLLYAVYELLELIGCRWVLPLRLHECIPRHADIVLPTLSLTREPSFEVRGFVEDPKHVPFGDERMLELHIQEVTSLIDWLGKMRLNSFLPHRVEPDDVLNIILPMMKVRAIEREVGGHIIPSLLPRELFHSRPELFRMNPDGERTADGNLCPSNEDALSIVASNAERLVSSTCSPFLHLWGEDLVKGGWCNCPACSHMTPQEQYLRVCEAVSSRLRLSGLKADVGYLAYHDTLEPTFCEVGEPIWFVYAPRERCYAHAINDRRCEINRRYYNALCMLCEAFEGRGYIFEYYGDALLFGSLMMPLTKTLKMDLKAYLELGLKRITCLSFGGYSWWAYGLNLNAFARMAWSVDWCWRAEDYFESLYGSYGGAIASIYERVELALLPLAEYHDLMLALVKDAEDALGKVKRIEHAISVLNECHKESLALWQQMHKDGERFLAMRWLCDIELMRITVLLLMLLLHMLGSKSKAEHSTNVLEGAAQASPLLARQLKLHPGAIERLTRSVAAKLSPSNRSVHNLLLGTWGCIGAPKYLKRIVERIKRLEHL
ncbi:MAG: DUF4838 domain-containing protein [Armatimonadota bacterium]|nr:DUF4838 domain-containing protein [Armatimonadota bacterium]MCX7777474.1 DUF4838 domain-containing protein [Armatimonadota bacterium]MDW8025517.1 DUF4838 domain-containing protein [Armatimonadota bacterium]